MNHKLSNGLDYYHNLSSLKGLRKFTSRGKRTSEHPSDETLRFYYFALGQGIPISSMLINKSVNREIYRQNSCNCMDFMKLGCEVNLDRYSASCKY